MSRRLLFNVAAILCVGGMLYVSARSVETSGSHVHIAETVHIGIAKGGKLEHDFVIENAGSKVLQIRKIQASCGCTVLGVSKLDIAPGESGRLPVVMETANVQRESAIYLETNDLKRPSLVLRILSRPRELCAIEIVPWRNTARIPIDEHQTVSIVLKVTDWDLSGAGKWEAQVESADDRVRPNTAQSRDGPSKLLVWDQSDVIGKTKEPENSEFRTYFFPVDLQVSSGGRPGNSEVRLMATATNGNRKCATIGNLTISAY